MIVKLRTEHHLEFLSLKGGFRGSSESTHVKNTVFLMEFFRSKLGPHKQFKTNDQLFACYFFLLKYLAKNDFS